MLGGACSVDSECEVGLECRDDVCSVPLASLGEECKENEECEQGLECREDICFIPFK